MTNDPTDAPQPQWQQPGSAGQWPTLGGRTPQPVDPLSVTQRRSLAPENLPGRPSGDTTPAPQQDAPALPPDQGRLAPCPTCGSANPTYAAFCEDCGARLTPTTARPQQGRTGHETPLGESASTQPPLPVATLADPAPEVDLSQPAQRGCPECGGVVGPDGYCTACGAKATRQRDHFVEAPAPWVGGVSDRGIRHTRNEDAMALAATDEPGSHAVLVVCDGVSTSQDSDVASLAGARAARTVLTQPREAAANADAAAAAALVEAARQANDAVIRTTAADSRNAASCTFVAAIVESGRVHVANVGDSRGYWLPDAGQAQLLTVDDSVAQARIAMGVSREEAEQGYQAHAITKWLGRDSEDITPRTAAFQPTSPGWLLLCTDGLWNYCSEAPDMANLLHARAQGGVDPVTVAQQLVEWACAQGGKDNITVALARLEVDGGDAFDLDADTVPAQ